jgi:hypothetical protein
MSGDAEATPMDCRGRDLNRLTRRKIEIAARVDRGDSLIGFQRNRRIRQQTYQIWQEAVVLLGGLHACLCGSGRIVDGTEGQTGHVEISCAGASVFGVAALEDRSIRSQPGVLRTRDFIEQMRGKRRRILCARDRAENYLLFNNGGVEAQHPRNLSIGRLVAGTIKPP